MDSGNTVFLHQGSIATCPAPSVIPANNQHMSTQNADVCLEQESAAQVLAGVCPRQQSLVGSTEM